MSPIYKSFAKYLGLFLVVFIALFLVLSTNSGSKAVNSFYTKTHIGLYKSLFPKLRVKLEQPGQGTTDWNTLNFNFGSMEEEARIIAEARKKKLQSVDIPLDTASLHLNVFYTPFFIFLIALFLATPIPVKSKFTGLLAGLLLLFIYQAIRIFFKLLLYVNDTKIGVYDFEGFQEKVLFYASNIMQAGFSTMVVVLIWAFIVFNKENTKHIKNKLGIS